MRNFVPISLLMFFAFTLCTCVKEKDPEPLTLPPITMEGKNTMGCMINGDIFTVSGKALRDGWSYNGTHASYTSSSSSGAHPPYISFRAQQPSPEIQVFIKLALYEGQSIYELNNKEKSVGIVTMLAENFIFARSEYTTTSIYKGRVEILKFVFDSETGDGIMSGLFEFDAIDSRGDVIEVREGRFDLSFGW